MQLFEFSQALHAGVGDAGFAQAERTEFTQPADGLKASLETGTSMSARRVNPLRWRRFVRPVVARGGERLAVWREIHRGAARDRC